MFRNIAAPEIFVAAKRFSRRRPVRTFQDGNRIKPPPLIPISVVVAAPHGISTCLLPPEFFAAADGESLELVLADAGENYADQSTREGSVIDGVATGGSKCKDCP